MLRRLLERPCSLALLVGCQFAFVAYFSLGGFRNLTALLGRPSGPAVDYSRTRDVYENLSRLLPPRNGPPDPRRELPFCPERSPFLGGGVLEIPSAPSPCFSSFPGREFHVQLGEAAERGGSGGDFGDLRRGFKVSPVLPVLPIPFPPSQAGNSTFNRAKLLNVGVKEALKDEDWDCLFLHDVDLIPENDHNLYTCDPWNPKHVSVAMNKFSYSLPYPQYFGGVSALTPDQYMKINGFPNEYWGWGGEDDDIATRVRLAGMKISRPPVSIGHYKMVKHKSDKGNEENPHR
ncbi:B4GT3 galactosyltransferase, partial [Pitta sordida]|nr:B4GT3 galactosyltransferase [Pitta sordida]